MAEGGDNRPPRTQRYATSIDQFLFEQLLDRDADLGAGEAGTDFAFCEALLESGHEVAGIDSFTPYYSPAVKERNVAIALKQPRYRLHRLDLRTEGVDEVIRNADILFHLAATPGLVQSWTDFDNYLTCNTQATQRLLDTIARSGKGLQRFIYVSTSSVYGKYALGDEASPTKRAASCLHDPRLTPTKAWP